MDKAPDSVSPYLLQWELTARQEDARVEKLLQNTTEEAKDIADQLQDALFYVVMNQSTLSMESLRWIDEHVASLRCAVRNAQNYEEDVIC